MRRHDVGQVVQMQLAAPAPLRLAAPAQTAAQGSIAPGPYIVQTPAGAGATLYSRPSTGSPHVGELPEGAPVTVTDSATSNFFASVSAGGSFFGYVAVTSLVPAPAIAASTPVPGGPLAGANTPRDFPGPNQPPAGPPGAVVPPDAAAPHATKIPWLPLGAAAVLGWFFLVEQKKKKGGGGKRKARRR